jgi:3-hydroxyacyl-[acyl-carrier-protein] dehydratase
MHEDFSTAGDLSRQRPASIAFGAPLRAVDHVEVVGGDDAGGLELSAQKSIDPEDPYVSGHFPGFPIYPGVFVVETVLQAIALASGVPDGRVPRIVDLRQLRLLAPLLAGDTLRCRATVTRRDEPGLLDVAAHVRRGDGRLAARVELEVRSLDDDARAR